MGVPTQAKASVTVSGTDPVCVPVLAIPRGEITRLLVKQLDGDADGFTVKLYDRAVACDQSLSLSVSHSLSAEDEAEADQDPALHQIGPGWTVPGGSTELRQEGLQLSYRNRDPLPDNKVPVQRVYVQLTPTAGGGLEKQFEIYLLILAPDFD